MKTAQWSVKASDRKSDDRLDFELQSRVTDYLAHRDDLAFRSIEIDVESGTVTLTGGLRSYYEKQIAMTCTSVQGVSILVDRLTVPDWDVLDDEFPFTLR